MLKRYNGDDKREFGRRQTCSTGWIRCRDRTSIPCTIINISEGGALLQPLEPVELPFQFALCLSDNGPEIACEMRHYREGQVGVEFIVSSVKAVAGSPSRRPKITQAEKRSVIR